MDKCWDPSQAQAQADSSLRPIAQSTIPDAASQEIELELPWIAGSLVWSRRRAADTLGSVNSKMFARAVTEQVGKACGLGGDLDRDDQRRATFGGINFTLDALADEAGNELQRMTFGGKTLDGLGGNAGHAMLTPVRPKGEKRNAPAPVPRVLRGAPSSSGASSSFLTPTPPLQPPAMPVAPRGRPWPPSRSEQSNRVVVPDAQLPDLTMPTMPTSPVAPRPDFYRRRGRRLLDRAAGVHNSAPPSLGMGAMQNREGAEAEEVDRMTTSEGERKRSIWKREGSPERLSMSEATAAHRKSMSVPTADLLDDPMFEELHES